MNSILHHSNNIKAALRALDLDKVASLGVSIEQTWASENVVYVCGNGGSSAIAQHMVVDLSKGVKTNYRNPRIISLNDNVSVLTAISNDVSYTAVFRDQLNWLAKPKDLLITISSSGNSENILQVLAMSNELGLKSFGIFGAGGGKAVKLASESLIIPSKDTQVIEDISAIVGHMLYKYLNSAPNR